MSPLQLYIALVCDCYIEIVEIVYVAEIVFVAGRIVRVLSPAGTIGG